MIINPWVLAWVDGQEVAADTSSMSMRMSILYYAACRTPRAGVPCKICSIGRVDLVEVVGRCRVLSRLEKVPDRVSLFSPQMPKIQSIPLSR